MHRPWLVALSSIVLAGCPKQQSPAPPSSGPGPTTVAQIELSSASLKEGQTIDRRHTCDGEDRSPPLAWPAPPAGTRSLALIMDDPDAPSGTFTHWVLYGIPADRTSLPEGVKTDPRVEGVGVQGKNDFDKTGYGGPCPPPGKPHRYRFKLYALSQVPKLEPGASKAEVERALEGATLGQGLLTGTYARAQ